ncbi:MAG: hypothetical protein B7X08_06570, partial [Acidocella sp. 20-63-7]
DDLAKGARAQAFGQRLARLRAALNRRGLGWKQIFLGHRRNLARRGHSAKSDAGGHKREMRIIAGWRQDGAGIMRE